MKLKFKRIGVMGKPNVLHLKDTICTLIDILASYDVEVVVETECAKVTQQSSLKQCDKTDIADACDLIIVIGGDGSLLNAARAVVDKHIPICGINRGRLGFLTDISPADMSTAIPKVLQGEYEQETRFLLTTSLERQGNIVASAIALNDVVLYSGDIARMIEFEIYINNNFVCAQRSDGLITATPTGSTAYALSGGGPILHPSLAAIVMVPMHPHTLSSRPIVINANDRIHLRVTPGTDHPPRISCDGQIHIDTDYNDIIHIKKYAHEVTILHPTGHDYFSVLRGKLGWETHK